MGRAGDVNIFGMKNPIPATLHCNCPLPFKNIYLVVLVFKSYLTLQQVRKYRTVK